MLLLPCLNYSFGQAGVSAPIVQSPVYFDVSPPLRDMVKHLPPVAETSWKDGIVRNKFNIKPRPQGQVPAGLTDPGLQTDNGTTITDTTIVNFDGNTNTEGYYPPDTHGDVGPNHYFQVVNCHYSIYSKTGALLLGPLANSSVFTGLPNNSNDGDAVVLYDEQADRWFFTQFSLPNYPAGPFYQMIAVSTTGDPTGTWARYQYSFTNMPDYPKFGVWGDGYYMSMHMFTATAGNYAGIGAVAFNRTLMLAGSPAATMIMFTKPASDEAYGWLPSDCDGPFPTGNPPNYFLYSFDGGTDHLGIYEFHVDWVTTANSSYTNFLSLPVNAFSVTMTGVTQPGTTVKLDVLNDRMMYRLQYRSFAGYSTLVCNHTVDISGTVAGIRWYELRKSTGAWSIFQQGTYSLADNNSRWMGSIAMDSSGNIAMGYSVSGTSLYPSIRYTGRKKNDALNQMTIAEKGIFNGGGSQTGSAARWGDYSAISCDPIAKATYWYTTEYLATTSATGWRTRIASFKFANVPVVSTNAATGITCTGATLNGSVNPNGYATNYHFEWGTTVAYGNSTTVVSAGAGSTSVPVTAPITGLTGGTTYHFRVVAVNAEGTTNGLDMTFVPCAAVVITTAASAITTTTATSGGNVTSDGGAAVTVRGVCWGTAANPTTAGSHTTDASGLGVFTSSLTGLLANTTYHVRAYATNTSGTSYGSDLIFITLCNISTLPFSESFSATTIPSCWSQADIQGNGQIWQFGVITGQTPLPALTGNYAFLNSRGYGTGNSQNADLITPTIDMTGYTNITLQFNHYFRSTAGTSGTVSYSINNGSTWTIIQTFTVTTANPEAFNQVIAALAGQSAVKFKWNYTGTYGRYWGVDDVAITGTISGPFLTVTPPNQNVTAAAGTTPFTVSASTAWTAVSNQTWCTVTPSGSGSGTITATYTQNTLPTSRVANVTVTMVGLPPVVVTVTQAGAITPTLTVTPPNQNVSPAAGTTPFTVSSNSAWSVTSDQTWCTVTPSGTGNGTITATYTLNTLITSRVANVTVTVVGLSPIVVTVTQAGTALSMSVTPPNQSVSSAAGATNFTVTTNTVTPWSCTSDQTWCTVTSTGTGNGTITANYAQNTLPSSRVANITVTVAGVSPVVVTVSQAGMSPTLSVTPPNQTVTSLPGSTTFTVSSNSSWIVSSDQTWCTVTPSGTGNGTILANYTENTSVVTRVANITVTVSGLPPVVVMVTQMGAAATLSVTPSNQNVTAPAGNTAFTVTSNSSWSSSSDQGWCAVTSSGNGNGVLTATYQENLSVTQRVANITVLVNGLGPVVVTVTQAGVSPTLFVTPSNRNVPVAPGTTNFTVASNSNWTSSSNVSWCTVTPSGTGNGTIDAVYQENTGLNPRTAIVTVTVGGLTPVTTTVSQEGTVGLPEWVQSNIMLYPNPNKGKFTISTADHNLLEMEITIITMEGKIVSVTNCSGRDSYTFDLSDKPRGNYVVRIKTAEGTSTRKIIID
ncbi:MAG: BACON domain-containing carbohydrate-binding protein [bacterium]